MGSVVGHYKITGELKTGGMGEVFRATHELIGKPAAVKLLRPEFSANTEMVERFFNEARAATAIRHPGIVEVFDFGYHDSGRAYLVMEFLEGETLSDRLLGRTRLSEAEAATITRGIASALAAAHSKGIVHRDLKPDNVFLVPDPDMPSGERPKVLDFGIAKLADGPEGRVSQTRTGALMGTPAYMAPEQARAAGDIDQRADLYSVGCMLYEMLTGHAPFVAEGAGEIIAMQLFGVAERPSALVPELSNTLDDITMKLLEKDPADRFQNAAELVETLAKVLPGLTGTFSAVSPSTSMNSLRRPAVAVPTPTSIRQRPSNLSSNGTQSNPGLETPEQIYERSAQGLAAAARRSLAPSVAPPSSNSAIKIEHVEFDNTREPVHKSGSSMGIVAALVTIALVGGIAAFLLLRSPTTPAAAPVVQTDTPAVAADSTSSKSIKLHVKLSPDDAVLSVDGRPVAIKQGVVELAKDGGKQHHLVVSAVGYALHDETIVFDADKNFTTELTKLATPAVDDGSKSGSGRGIKSGKPGLHPANGSTTDEGPGPAALPESDPANVPDSAATKPAVKPANEPAAVDKTVTSHNSPITPNILDDDKDKKPTPGN